MAASSSPLPRLGKMVDARQTVDQTMKFQGRSVLDHVPGREDLSKQCMTTRLNSLVVGVDAFMPKKKAVAFPVTL